MSLPPRILVCDHRGEGLQERVAPLEKAGFQVEVCASLRSTLERVQRGELGVLVVDPLSDNGTTELEAIEQARPPGQLAPILLVAEAQQAVPDLVGARAGVRGAWDLIRRDAPLEEFLMRLELLRHYAERLAEMELLRHRATHDDRTDLLRPKSFQERLKEHFSAAQRHGLDLALLLIDLDDFGAINKTFDHTVGDQLIADVGRVVRGALRAEDVAGRLGGDEFAVLLPYTKKVDAANVVQRLLEEIKDLSGRLPGAREARVSASIGFETFNGSDLETVEELRSHAEQSLRVAKRRGGNRGVFHRSPEE